MENEVVKKYRTLRDAFFELTDLILLLPESKERSYALRALINARELSYSSLRHENGPEAQRAFEELG